MSIEITYKDLFEAIFSSYYEFSGQKGLQDEIVKI